MTRITNTINAAYTTVALTDITDSRGRSAVALASEQMRALQEFGLDPQFAPTLCWGRVVSVCRSQLPGSRLRSLVSCR